MKFISLQENLKRGLNIVGHATIKNVNLPILNNILIKTINGNIELTGTNLEIGIKHTLRGKIEKEGEFTVDSKLITDYVNLLSSGERIEVEEKNKELKIKASNYKTNIKGEEAKDFPLIPTISEDTSYVVDLNDFKKSLSQVVFAVSNSENRVELTGVLFTFHEKILSLAATDSYRLAEKQVKIKSADLKDDNVVIVPSKTILELLRILNNFNFEDDVDSGNEIKISISDNQILFTFDSVSLISRLINGRYPDYKQIIPSKSITEVKVVKSELVRAVKAVALFSKSGINDITMVFLKNKISLSSFSGASGESQADVLAQIDGEENEITINYRYLLDGLNNIDGENVIIKVLNNNTPCLIKQENSDDYLYIVMPIKQ